ncbi:MAG: dihydrodipicolinate reductase [Desulfobacteraceae bacterium]|nr:dihydrodipicolinate reductase [Desulfobacteraceae bacterium]
MKKIKVMLNGLPGNVAKVIARHIMTDPRLVLLPYALTGPDIDASHCHIGSVAVELIRPDALEKRMAAIMAAEAPFISVDYTHPTAVNANAQFYCRQGLPFVMGTTGGDRQKLHATVIESNNVAVIAPNMAKQIVGFQAMMAYAAENFPDLFKGYRLSIRESHQAGKADTSGTAKAMVDYFNKMGIPFSADQIQMERDPERQANLWGIPTTYLGGHGWHTYTLISPDDTVKFEFTHNINGREIYGQGTVDAVCFLADKVAQGATAKVFSMIDVLTAGKKK